MLLRRLQLEVLTAKQVWFFFHQAPKGKYWGVHGSSSLVSWFIQPIYGTYNLLVWGWNKSIYSVPAGHPSSLPTIHHFGMLNFGRLIVLCPVNITYITEVSDTFNGQFKKTTTCLPLGFQTPNPHEVRCHDGGDSHRPGRLGLVDTSRWFRNPANQLRLVVYPIIYKVLAPSQMVVSDFWTINSRDPYFFLLIQKSDIPWVGAVIVYIRPQPQGGTGSLPTLDPSWDVTPRAPGCWLVTTKMDMTFFSLYKPSLDIFRAI